jgi:hypothetical protein
MRAGAWRDVSLCAPEEPMSSNPRRDAIDQQLDDWQTYLRHVSLTLNSLVNGRNVLWASERAEIRAICSRLNLICKNIEKRLPAADR